MASEKARIAVIGAGWWSTYTHIPGLLGNPDAELVAICDRSPEALERAVQAYGPLKLYQDYQALLAEEALDGMVVATNHSTHYEVAKACLEAGKHVMLEKPMVLRAAEAHELVALADRQGRELIIGYPWHFSPITRQARDLLQTGELGAIQFVSSLMASMVVEFYRGNDQAYRPVFNYPVTGPGTAYADPKLSGGGQGHLQVTHSAGTLFFITGLRAERVTCFMENWDVPVDLVDAISVHFADDRGRPAVGVVGSTGNIGPGDGGQHELSVYCEDGYLRLNQSNGSLYVRRHNGQEEHFGPLAVDESYPRFATSQNLVDVILRRAENGSPAVIGARVVELLDAAYRSSAMGGQVVRVADLN
jgi:predicted dehydrogenase